MSNSYFQFKQFTIQQDKCAMKVTTDACLFGAFVANEIDNRKLTIENMLDIGTGSGLLSLMFAQKNDSAHIDAIEIDKDAVEQARQNVAACKWKDRIKIFETDARSFLSQIKYDLIISNPPFYENELRSGNKKKNVAHHSELLALEALIIIVKANLTPTGNFFLLLPYKRNEEIKKLFRDNHLSISKVLFIRQSVNHEYFRLIIQGRLKNGEEPETAFDELSITGEQQQYTTAFTSLLKDYYFYL